MWNSLKCIFEFMINTASPASNSVYGREKLFRCEKINFSNRVCHCGAVVKELLAPTDKPGSTTGDTVFCFFVQFFFLFGLFWTLFFLLAFFFVILTADPAGACTWINIYFKRKSGVYFGKRISKALDLHTGQPLCTYQCHAGGGTGGRAGHGVGIWLSLLALG